MSTLFTLGVVFALPYIVRVISNLRQKQLNGTTAAKRERTRYDDACTILLLVVCFALAGSTIVNPPPNLMRQLDLSIDAPSFVVRNRFRDFMNANFHGWVEGWSNPATAPPGVIMVPARDSDVPQTAKWGTPETRRQALYYERVAEKLKSDELRKLYHRYGEAAVVGCTWCQENSDYFLWLSPGMGAAYGGVLALVGITTLARRKEGWRMYAAVAVMTLAAVESYIYLSNDIRVLPLQSMAHTLYEMVILYRRIALAFLLLCVNFVDTGDDYSEQDLLENIGTRAGLHFSKLVAARLGRGATLGDEKLRGINMFTDLPNPVNVEQIPEAQGTLE